MSEVRFQYRMRKARLQEWWPTWVANRLPHEVVSRAAIRLIAHGTCGKWGSECVNDVDPMILLKRWDEPNKEPEENNK